MTIHEVMGYGPVVFGDQETDTLITINGSYLNWWAGDFRGMYQNTDCRSLSHEGGLYQEFNGTAKFFCFFLLITDH
jgi:hypothetical protein